MESEPKYKKENLDPQIVSLAIEEEIKEDKIITTIK